MDKAKGLPKLADKGWFKLTLTVSGVLFVFLLWYMLSLGINSSLFPGPVVVFEKLGHLLAEAAIYQAIGGTLLRLLLSFVFSFVISMAFGILAGLNPSFHRFINPLIVVMRTIPTAALILVLIVLLKPPYALFIIVFLVMFPIMFEAVASGLNNVDPSIMMALRLDGSPYGPRSLFRVLLPLSKSYILLGVVQAIGLGMKVSIMSEVLLGNSSVPGLGILLKGYYNYAEMDGVLAVSLVAILLIGVIDLLLHAAKKALKSKI